MKVKIFGAGSIGNHMAHASRQLGWTVHLCDTDPLALSRSREQIYPQRYGQWDETIQLYTAAEVPQGSYDLIIIGTPPDSHLPLLQDALSENPRAILVEKPLATPDLQDMEELYQQVNDKKVRVFVGYDHVVGSAAVKAGELISTDILGEPETLDVEFREHWGGIFAAHPWLDGPEDTYLGYWQRGGGALGEHSHALNLWQHLARQIGAGPVVEVSAMLEFVQDGEAEYDKLAALHLRTESGFYGRVVQDVVTIPPRKWARLQGDNGYLEWHANRKPGVDAVIHQQEGAEAVLEEFSKTRPDDFIAELRHIEHALNEDVASPIDWEHGLDTMLVIAAAYRSAQHGHAARIDPSIGYTAQAIDIKDRS